MNRRIITLSEQVLNENRFDEVRKVDKDKGSWFRQNFKEFCSTTALVGAIEFIRISKFSFDFIESD